MLHSDDNLIFESYFHAINNAINEARGRKKQYGERVKQMITDPKTGEQRLESYYEMMQRLKRAAINAASESENEPISDEPTIDEPTTEEPYVASGSVEDQLRQKIADLQNQLTGQQEPDEDAEPDEDVDIDIGSKPIEDVGAFNFNTTLTLGDKYEQAPLDAMTQDILQYVEDTPATGKEIVNFLIDKGVNEVYAKNKVASLALLDILKLYFSGEETPKEIPGEISIPDEQSGEMEYDPELTKDISLSNDDESEDDIPKAPKELKLGGKEPKEQPDEDLESTLKMFLPLKKFLPSGKSEEEKRKEFVNKMLELRRQRAEEKQKYEAEEKAREKEIEETDTEISDEDEPVSPDEL